MKSRLDGFKTRLKDQQSSLKPKISSGVGIARIATFWAVLLIFVIILFIPENPLYKYELHSKARDTFRARVDFTFSRAEGVDEAHAKGKVIVSKGSTIDEYTYELLKREAKEYENQNEGLKGSFPRLAAFLLLVLAVLSTFIVYGNEFLKLRDFPLVKIFYLALAIAGSLLCAKLLGLFFSNTLWIFTPLAIVAVVASIALGPTITSVATLFSTPLFIAAFLPRVDIAIAVCIAATVIPFLTSKARKRNDLLKAGLIIGVFHLLFILAFGLLTDGTVESEIVYTAFFGFISGIATGAAATFILPMFEWMFDSVTDISLLELSDLNHPLLKRMLLEASGTYQHSLLVATISEHAAESIGANALFAKVGALFHDIGKMVRPQYFTENNPAATGLHGKLKYSLSAMLIISHTKDGAELAKEYNLPRPIIDIIVEHQGTTLVEYFYRKALEQRDSLALPDEQFYQYPGPKPSTKESAIVMVADSVEALTRSLKNPSTRRIQEAVHTIIMKKLNDRQFDDCSITLKELNTIEQSITWIVRSMFHQRIEYPNPPKMRQEKPHPQSKKEEEKPVSPAESKETE